jgi:hypothetical protein
MSEARWKRHERLVAGALGGRRQPITGRPSPDVLTPEWACEVKTRRSLPRWLLMALSQAEAGGRATGRRPLLVLVYAPGQGRKARRFAILPLEALLAWRRESDGGKEVTP